MGVYYGPTSYYQRIFLDTVTSTVTVTYNNNKGTSINAFKTSGSNAWDAQVSGLSGFQAPCTIEFNKLAGVTDNGQSYAMIGWNEDASSDSSYTSLDYAAYPYRTDTYSVYHNSTQVLFSGAWDSTKTFYIVYDKDGYIRHYNGSTLLYTSPLYGTGKTVYLDSSFYTAGNYTTNGFSNIRIAKKSWNGTAYV